MRRNVPLAAASPRNCGTSRLENLLRQPSLEKLKQEGSTAQAVELQLLSSGYKLVFALLWVPLPVNHILCVRVYVASCQMIG